MTITEAHKISLMGYVASLGYKPIETNRGRYVCPSPFRPNEKTPSFYLYYNQSKTKWTFKDFGSNDKGGDIIDFVMALHNVSELGALAILDSPELSIAKYFSFIGSINSRSDTNDTAIEIKHIQPLQNRALLQYLSSRNINPTLAAKYCNEAYYKTTANDKQYFSVSFENNSSGHELRNKYFKGSTSPKDITTIEGANQTAVNVFEGFMDFLSALTYFKTDRANCTTIVLNGVGFIEKLIEVLPNYTKINLYLDTDQAGQKATKLIQNKRPEAVNRSKMLYPSYKDFNDFLTSSSQKARLEESIN